MSRYYKKTYLGPLLGMVLSLLTFQIFISNAAAGNLVWDPVSAEGSYPVVGYKIHYGTSSGTYSQVVDVRILELNSAGYTNCVPGDVGKTVTGGTTSDTGTLLAYDNTVRKWWVQKADEDGDEFDEIELVTISGGTRQGTTIAANDNEFTRVLELSPSGYTDCAPGDVGKTVTGGTTGDTGTLLAYDNTVRKWWVRMGDASDTFDQAESVTISGGTGQGTTIGASGNGFAYDLSNLNITSSVIYYYLAVAAYTSIGEEGFFSDETIYDRRPSAPTGLKIKEIQ